MTDTLSFFKETMKQSKRDFYIAEDGTTFSQKQTELLQKSVTVGRKGNECGSTMDLIRKKIRRIYPEWSEMPNRCIIFRFAYKEGLAKL